jgi:hypothetical protein
VRACRLPQRGSFLHVPLDREHTTLHIEGDELLQALSPGIGEAAFPGANGAQGRPQQRGEVALGQASPLPQGQRVVGEAVVAGLVVIDGRHAASGAPEQARR